MIKYVWWILLKNVIIVNPVAGNAKNFKKGNNLKKILNKNGVDADVIVSDGPNRITSIVNQIAKVEKTRFYSVGGDGTLNEVISGLIGTDSEVVVIPAGTGNDFTKSVSCYKSMRKIALASINSVSTPTDVILFNNKYYCINILNLGLDAKIAENMNKFRKIPFITGSMKYNLSIFYTLAHAKNYKLKVRIGDFVEKGSYTLAAIANGKYYGGGVCPSPDANTTDGILNVTLVKNSTLMQKLILLPRYKKGKHKSIKQLRHFKTDSITVVSNKKFPVSVDGEIIITNRIHAKVVPSAINVVHIKE